MSHGRACSESASTRCKCSCGGSLHGAIGAPVYRSLASSYQSSGGFTKSDRHAKARSYGGAADKLANRAVDVLVEVIQRYPNDADALCRAVQEVVSKDAWQLLLPRVPPGRRIGRSHWLCQALAECAEMLDQLADIAGTIEDAVYEDCRDAGWGRLRSKAISAAVGQLVRVTLAPPLAPLAVLSMKARVVALMFCPDTAKHPALEQSCTKHLLDALDIPSDPTA